MRNTTQLAAVLLIGAGIMAAASHRAGASSEDWLMASDRANIIARGQEWADERDPKLMQRQERVLRGTIEDYLEASPGVKVLTRVGNGVIVTSKKFPELGWIMCQVKSVQGNDIVLGPKQLPWRVLREEDVRNWIFPVITVAFDEEKHYAGPYIDRSNRVDLFVIYERRPGEAMPVAVIYTPRDVPNPLLVTESQNEKERVYRGVLRSSELYRQFERLKRSLDWMKN